ncbi:bifunctional 4-hydroxy-2-oxoglutarate aldolase/2-dehydro-3-deoxy-phosphogluconate aldolase [Actinoallomurus soli]|uniref:bifunctional 4-hydroxy-2-oxoglutarate aldolase/2-dehydro-3-deoxy-phosphogluconate aldolase n=1 Tax=Actinoallomurus soli TaxID=2952535 RepID=UPI002092AAF3|nr:bifunctional 4-hydroxy-2-oxoglutarate aldolase/2-dehydro-3-deoxy-phosphogluconate aldolase [Actinoallomurus soli]MCO5970540.1 bifunctional 4-hydroxy-2-oxoglutarate aldolase/2-dehydro-3-deoxy-phosphogluconate aldolase [Actinoallomurus soli]
MTTRVSPGPVLLAGGVVAVVRGTSGDRTDAVLDTLTTAGVRCLEVTLNTPGAIDSLRAARRRLPGDVELGAGTVLTAEQVDAAADAGASFVVAPDTRPQVAERAAARGIAYYPGALTPTEIGAAWELGASAVKVFPAGTFGPGYLRDLRGPFRDIPLLPTGGIGVDVAGDYIRAGAIAVGVGGPLLGDALDGGPLDALADRARRLVAAVAGARG